jgi:phosphate-selective porin OprO/OprP
MDGIEAMRKTLFAGPRRLSLALTLAVCVGAAPVLADESPFGFNTATVAPTYHTAALSVDQADGLIESGETEDGAVGTVPLKDYEKLLDRVGDLESSWEKYQDKLKTESDEKKKKPSYKLNGRIHLDNWNFLDTDAGINELETGNPNDDPEDRWDFRRIRLTWSGTVPHNMLYRIQIDFNNPMTPEIKDVYLGFNNLPHNQVFLIGNQKRPIGLDHLNSSRHNMFVERPLAVEAFNEDARRMGMCMYGYNDSPAVVNWRYGAFLLENSSTDGRYRGDFDEGGLYARLAASPWYDEISGGRGYWHCAIAGSVNQTDADGQTDLDRNDNEARFRTRPEARSDSRWWDTGRIAGAEGYQQLAVESMLNIGAFQLTGEYFGNWMQRDAANGFNGSNLNFHGGYLFANYFLTGEFIPLERTSGTIGRVKPFENFFVVDRCCGGHGHGWGALSVGVRGSYLDLSDSDIRGGRGGMVTFGTNWWWTAYSKLQVNYELGEIQDAGQGRSPGTPLAAGIGGNYSILGFRYMIDF